MKIAIVINSLIRGGAERQSIYAAGELARRGCSVDLIYYHRAENAYDERLAHGARLVYVPKEGTYWRFVGRLATQMRTAGYEVVHAFKDVETIYAALAGRRAGVPVMFGGIRVEYDSRWPIRLGHRWVKRRLAGWIVNSGAGGRSVTRALGVDPARIHVVYNGIDARAFQSVLSPGEARARLGLPRDCRTVGIVGRLAPQKNHALFLAAARIVRDRQPGARFLIIGEGPLRGELEAQAQQLGLSSDVVFLGNRPDMADLLAATDLSVLSSNYEGLANVLLEAMAAGVPVVSTAYAGVDELVTDGVQGFVVSMDDAAALAGRVCELLADDPLRRRMGEAGREAVARRFSIEAMGQRLLSVYEGALKARE